MDGARRAASYVADYDRRLCHVLHGTDARRYELPVAGECMVGDGLLAGETRDMPDKRTARMQRSDKLLSYE